MVFSGLYPLDTSDYEKLKRSVGKLRLNDASFSLSGRNLGSLRLWVSMRIPRLTAHGNHSREVERREYELDLNLDLPKCDISSHPDRRREPLKWITLWNFRIPSEIGKIEEPTIVARIHAPNESIGDLTRIGH